jgi:DNA transformation protein
MANSHDFLAYITELMRDGGVPTTSRRMFGGHGLYADGVFFAIVDDDVLYLKVDERIRAEFDALGCTPFEYATKDGVGHAMSYLRAPDEALERPDAMGRWAKLSLGAALRKAAAKKAPAPKKPARKTKTR